MLENYQQSLKGYWTGNSQLHQLGTVHLKQHASDLASELWLLRSNLRVQGLTKHLLLPLVIRGIELGNIDTW